MVPALSETRSTFALHSSGGYFLTGRLTAGYDVEWLSCLALLTKSKVADRNDAVR